METQKTQSSAGTTALETDFLAQTTDGGATGIQTRPIGKTGINVSILAVSGWHISAIKKR